LATEQQWTWLQDYRLVAPWTALVAFLLISDLATFSWSSFRIRRQMRLGLLVGVALLGAALFTAPWETLSVAALIYVTSIPFSIASYARVRRLRAGAAARPSPLEAPVLPEAGPAPARQRKSAPNSSAE
jgi:CDP-diacylglycerol--serine O-phosphatidyltransferase